MAIAFDSVSSGTITATNTSVTFAHTVSGSNTIGHVFVTQQNDASANRITGITWNGTAMSLIGTPYTNSGGDTLYLWELINPTTGDIIVTRTGTTNSGFCQAISHSGAKQSSQPDATASANTTTTSLATNITTVADNCWTILGTYDSDGGTITASTNSTQRNALTTYCKLFDNNTAITPAGAYTMTVTRASGSSPFSGVIASISPAVATPNNGAGFFALM